MAELWIIGKWQYQTNQPNLVFRNKKQIRKCILSQNLESISYARCSVFTSCTHIGLFSQLSSLHIAVGREQWNPLRALIRNKDTLYINYILQPLLSDWGRNRWLKLCPNFQIYLMMSCTEIRDFDLQTSFFIKKKFFFDYTYLRVLNIRTSLCLYIVPNYPLSTGDMFQYPQ